jgi:hypothetical protein
VLVVALFLFSVPVRLLKLGLNIGERSVRQIHDTLPQAASQTWQVNGR